MASRHLAIVSYAVTVVMTAATCGADKEPSAPPQLAVTQRIIAIGGAVTETIFALGAGDRLVATDTSSTYPERTNALPKLGYQRTLAAETVLSHRPDVIIASHEAGPPATLAQLRAAGVRVEILPEVSTPQTAATRILAIGEILGTTAVATELANAVARVRRPSGSASAKPPRVLFLYARGNGVAMVAGRDSLASEMIALAGGINAVDTFTGYKPLAGEAVIAAAPDLVLIPTAGLSSLGGPRGLWALPGFAATPAGLARRVVAMDDLLLLGFGPRLATATETLTQAFSAPR